MEHTHKFAEEYYGYQCEGCELFYPYGCAPWEDAYPDDWDDRQEEDYEDEL